VGKIISFFLPTDRLYSNFHRWPGLITSHSECSIFGFVHDPAALAIRRFVNYYLRVAACVIYDKCVKAKFESVLRSYVQEEYLMERRMVLYYSRAKKTSRKFPFYNGKPRQNLACAMLGYCLMIKSLNSTRIHQGN
jgi:hypothetical protein